MFLLGCGTDPAPSESAKDVATEDETAQSLANSATASLEPSETGLAATTDETGRKWLTPEIPYDVYPDLPSAAELIAARGEASPEPADAGIAATDAPVNMANSTANSEEEPSEEEAVASVGGAMTSSAASDAALVADDWGSILPAEILDNEISIVNNRLGRNLLTVGSYNTSFDEIRRDGWEMSALATIAAEHPESFSWKSNALLARDAAVALARAATGRGRINFQKAELAGERVAAVLNNNAPAGMDAPKSDLARGETAERAALMSRIQLAHDRLKELAIDEAALREHVDDLDREARVLAALAKFTSHSDYSGAENPDYQTMAKNLVDAGLGMARAVADEDLTAFQSAFDRASTACNACHQKYRFAE